MIIKSKTVPASIWITGTRKFKIYACPNTDTYNKRIKTKTGYISFRGKSNEVTEICRISQKFSLPPSRFFDDNINFLDYDTNIISYVNERWSANDAPNTEYNFCILEKVYVTQSPITIYNGAGGDILDSTKYIDFEINPVNNYFSKTSQIEEAVSLDDFTSKESINQICQDYLGFLDPQFPELLEKINSEIRNLSNRHYINIGFSKLLGCFALINEIMSENKMKTLSTKSIDIDFSESTKEKFEIELNAALQSINYRGELKTEKSGALVNFDDLFTKSEQNNSQIVDPNRNKEIGDTGELFVINYLREYVSMKPNSLRWLAKENITPGYDIEYTDPNGTLIGIEVKSTVMSKFSNIELTSNEYKAAIKMAESFHLALVVDVENNPKLCIIKNLTEKLNHHVLHIEPSRYKLSIINPPNNTHPPAPPYCNADPSGR